MYLHFVWLLKILKQNFDTKYLIQLYILAYIFNNKIKTKSYLNNNMLAIIVNIKKIKTTQTSQYD